jgi:hypothetical protein
MTSSEQTPDKSNKSVPKAKKSSLESVKSNTKKKEQSTEKPQQTILEIRKSPKSVTPDVENKEEAAQKLEKSVPEVEKPSVESENADNVNKTETVQKVEQKLEKFVPEVEKPSLESATDETGNKDEVIDKPKKIILKPKKLSSESSESVKMEIQDKESTSSEKSDNSDNEATEADSSVIFQAVGIITGKVSFLEENRATVTIGQNEYQLLYIPSKLRAFEGLKKEIAASSKDEQRLIVYPKITHFPRREQVHQISFQLVGFDSGKGKGVSDELQDLEFKFSGLWQFIPVCATPCISVFRNFTFQRLEYIKQAELAKKIKFMKASHIPLLWRDSPVRPFRFNPKAGKDQGHPVFIQVKAKFLPQRDVFGFVEEIAPHQETAPKFLKASKKDKALAQSNKKSRGPGFSGPGFSGPGPSGPGPSVPGPIKPSQE